MHKAETPKQTWNYVKHKKHGNIHSENLEDIKWQDSNEGVI